MDACIIYKVEASDLKQAGPMDKAAGIDRNVGQVACSDGRIIRMPRSKRLEARCRRHQRAMARRQRGSKRYEKAKATLKMRNRRNDWMRQTTRRIADEYGTATSRTCEPRI